MKKPIFLLLLVLSLLFVSCSNDEENKKDHISIAPLSELIFDCLSSSDTLTVSSSGVWEVGEHPSWISLEPSSGVDGDKLIVSVSSNPSSEDRFATLSVSSGTSFTSLTVTQYGRIETDYVDLGFGTPGVQYSYNAGSGTLTVSYPSGSQPSVTSGKAIVLPGEYGHDIRVIEHATVSGNTITMQTAQGDMSDLFRNIRFTLSTNPASPTRSADGCRIYTPVSYDWLEQLGSPSRAVYQTNQDFWKFEHDFSGLELYSGPAGSLYWDECRYYASISGEFTFDFGEKRIDQLRKKGDIKYVSYILTGVIGLDMQLHYNYNAQYSEEGDEIIKEHLHPTIKIPFRVGSVPVILTVDTHLGKYHSFQAEGNLDATTGVRSSYEINAGVEWTPDGGAHPTCNATPTVELLPFTIEAEATLEGKASYYPRVEVGLYNVVGPWFEPRPYLKESIEAGLTVSTDGREDIGWQANSYTGLDFRLGLDLEILGWHNDIWASPIYTPVRDKLLYQAPTRIRKLSPNDGTEVEKGETIEAEFIIESYSPLNNTYYPCPFALVNFEAECGKLDKETSIADAEGKVRVEWTPQPDASSPTRSEGKVERELTAKITDKNSETIDASTLTVKIDGEALCNDEHHVHAVDLGLSVKWACCNVGASSPEEYGGYYAWGETEEKSDYSWDTYKYWTDKDGDGSADAMYDWDEFTEIGIVIEYNHDCVRDISGTRYDVAHVKWGGSWRMPTVWEFEELVKKCTWISVSVNSVDGYKITGPNGNSIFMPSSGHRGLGLPSWGTFYYWSSTSDITDCGYTLIDKVGDGYGNIFEEITFYNNNGKYFGHTVRPVCN